MSKFQKPEEVKKRLKLFVYGPAGIGKTTAAIMFPNAAIIDTEKGTDFYSSTIKKSNSVVFQTTNPDEIKEELLWLLTNKHEHRTLIIDPMTQIYNAIQDKWTRIFEKNARSEKAAETQDFGVRYWGKVKGEMKSIHRILLQLDMNIIATSHQKDVYSTGMSKIGVTFDSMRGDDYIYDLIFRLKKEGNSRIAVTEKERAEIGLQKFPQEFEWSYENFCNFYGKEIIEKQSTPLVLATPEEVARLNTLVEGLKVDAETVGKWLTKCDVDTFADMSQTQIQSLIAYCEKKIMELTMTKKEK